MIKSTWRNRIKEIKETYKPNMIVAYDVYEELITGIDDLQNTLDEQNKWVRAQAQLLKFSIKECDRLRSLIAEEFGEEYD